MVKNRSTWSPVRPHGHHEFRWPLHVGHDRVRSKCRDSRYASDGTIDADDSRIARGRQVRAIAATCPRVHVSRAGGTRSAFS